MSSAPVDRAIRRRAAGRLGNLGYALLRSRTSEGFGGRVELVRSRIEQLDRLNVPDRRASPEVQRTYRRVRRLTAWDVWAQAAMAAEDLEIMLTALLDWRESGGDVFARCRSVAARGPGFFVGLTESWPDRLPRIARVPTAEGLLGVLNVAEANLLATGLSNSLREAVDDLYAVASFVPWDVRSAMMPYKHGFRWIIPSLAPIATDRRGREALLSAPDTAFVVDTTDRAAMIFTASDDEIQAALLATEFSVALESFVVSTVLSETESRAGDWGIALYGDSAEDAAQQELLARVHRETRRH